MKVEQFEENGVGRMGSVSIAAARTQVRGQCKSVRKPGQQEAGRSGIGELDFRAGLPELSLKMGFELAEKTVASGTNSHHRPPGNEGQAAAAERSSVS